MNIKRIIREEMDSFDWAKELTDDIRVGTCLKYSDSSTKWKVASIMSFTDGPSILLYNGYNSVTISLDNANDMLAKGMLSYCV